MVGDGEVEKDIEEERDNVEEVLGDTLAEVVIVGVPDEEVVTDGVTDAVGLVEIVMYGTDAQTIFEHIPKRHETIGRGTVSQSESVVQSTIELIAVPTSACSSPTRCIPLSFIEILIRPMTREIPSLVVELTTLTT